MTTMTVAPWTDGLRALGACADAITWAKTQPDLATAWAVCERGDWMLWLAGRCSGDPGSASRKPVVLAACACARLALPQHESRYPDDRRPRQAIETAEAWARGEPGVTLAMVRAAAGAAAAGDAAYDAAYAAYAAYAAAAAAAAAARVATLRQCANLVRSIIPEAPEPSAKPLPRSAQE